METKIKNSLFLLLVLALTLPAIQHKFRFFQEAKLHGHFEEIEKPKLSWKNWINGDFQTNQEKYLNQVTGFRPGFVRLHHELDYDLFHIIHGNAVVEGKEGYLFEESYVNSALGLDFIGEDSVQIKTNLLKQLQNKLNENGIKLLFVFAPGKGLIFKDKIPAYLLKADKGRTNYDAFLAAFKREQINHIDFQAYTAANLQKSKYALMCRTGIHWSNYMEFIAGDSVFNYLKKTWNLDFPKVKLKAINYYDKAFGTDADIENSLNLYRNLEDFPNMAYPHIDFSRKKGVNDPKILVVGDSFYWGIFNNYRYHLNEATFWYYFREQHPTNSIPIDPKTLNLKSELARRKVIILLFTDSNLKHFGYGFIERALMAYDKKTVN